MGAATAHPDAARLAATTRLECGVCWHVYDPTAGDPVWQVPPGTPFAALPPGWSCPECASPPERFLVLDEDARPAPVAALEQAYRAIAAGSMRDLPLANPLLGVATVGFRRWEEGWLGILATPWCMNVTLLPQDAQAWAGKRVGTKETRSLPAGDYEFVVAHVDGVGPLLSCSLFSPMFEFDDPAVVRLTAEAALQALLEPGEAADAEPAAETPRACDRREFFRRALAADGTGQP